MCQSKEQTQGKYFVAAAQNQRTVKQQSNVRWKMKGQQLASLAILLFAFVVNVLESISIIFLPRYELKRKLYISCGTLN